MLPSPVTTPWPVRVVLLLLPPLIALAVWLDGQRYDPGLLDFKAGAARTEGAHMFPEGLGTLQRMGPVREYTRENLYEYINGHADFFIGAGFRHLTVSEYGPPGARQPTLVVDGYDMGKPLQAFGVLTDQKGSQAQAVNVGDMAFAADRTLAFIKGPFYVRLAAFDNATPLLPLASQLAEKMRSGAAHATSLTFAFPDLGQVGETRFVKESYRGMLFLNNVVERLFTGEKGETRTAFLIVGTPEEMTALEKAILDFLRGEGIQFHPEVQGESRIVRVTDPYEGNWLFAVGRHRLLGVFGPLQPEHVQRLGEFAKQE
ncbi:MAG: hypothetical protein HQL64_00380 [Magnetococcales bacterium]|nr:hypothetical protein [Magnetococcales bacterium]